MNQTLRMRLLLFVFACGMGNYAVANIAANELLLQSAREGSIEGVQAALDKGADPNWYAGKRFNEKPICIATLNGNFPLLVMLLDAGADPNVSYFYESDIFSKSPLGCAANSKNLEAYKLLHDRGAELDRDLCTTCDSSKIRTNALTYTLGGDKFDILRYILEHYNPTEGQIRGLLHRVENLAVYQDDKTLDDREWIAEWLRDRGHEVIPREPWPARQ